MKSQANRETTAGNIYLDLQSAARKSGRVAGELLELYALEGFLSRLAVSPYASQFVLKGGALLAAYDERRPTQDVDQIRGAGPVLQGGVSPGPAVRPGAAAARCTAG